MSKGSSVTLYQYLKCEVKLIYFRLKHPAQYKKMEIVSQEYDDFLVSNGYAIIRQQSRYTIIRIIDIILNEYILNRNKPAIIFTPKGSEYLKTKRLEAEKRFKNKKRKPNE